MSSGHSTRHTTGLSDLVPASHTPPAPSVEASQNPTYPGSVATSSRQCVGRLPKTFMMVAKSWSASRRTWLPLIFIQRFSPCNAASMGPISPLPAGMPIQAWRNRPRSCSNIFRGAIHLRAIWWSSLVSRSTLLAGSLMHRRAPSNTHPNISLPVSQVPSPWCNFLREIGSLPA